MATRQRGVIGRFFFGILRFIRNYFILVGVLVTVAYAALIFVLAKGSKLDLEPGGPSLSSTHPSVLWLELAGKVSEREPSFQEMVFSHLLGGEKEIYLPELRTALRRAAKDARISALVVNMLPMSASAADYAELRHLIADYREKSSKPVRVFLADAADWGYYVATAGSSITLNPAGEVAIPGPTFQLVYFAEALKRLGVSIDVVRAGKFKSAFEPFVTNQPSEPTLEEYNSMQQSLLDHIVSLVAKGRGKDESTVRGWYKRSLYTPETALQAGIIDAIGYPPQETAVAEAASDDHPAAKAEEKEAKEKETKDKGAKKKTDKGPESSTAAVDMHEGEPETISIEDYVSTTRKDKGAQELVEDQGGIGLIDAVGEITLSPKGRTTPGGSDDGINPAEMRKKIHWAMENKDVKAVVLRISSPGGSATASDLIWNDLKLLAEAKPLIVSMGAYAASGGYYIATPARKIVAEPTTVTGSIGVIGMLPSAQAFEDKWGVSFHMISSSDRKQMLNLGSHATPEDKALLDETIASVYKTFLQKVADGRKMPFQKVADLAQGRVYTGLQGRDLGLVDEIGGLDVAFRVAKNMVGFDATKLYPVLHYEDDSFNLSDCLKRPSKMGQCLKRLSSQVSAPQDLLSAQPSVTQVADQVAAWAASPQREQVLTLWGGYLSLVWR